MLKKLSFILGIIGSWLALMLNLSCLVHCLCNTFPMILIQIDFSPIIYFSIMILLSFAAFGGIILINKKRKITGILLCASGAVMLIFGLVTSGIIYYAPIILIIAAGVLAFVAKDGTPQKANDQPGENQKPTQTGDQ